MPERKRPPRTNEIADAASGVFGIRVPVRVAVGNGLVSSGPCGAAAAGRRRRTSSGPSNEGMPLGDTMAVRLWDASQTINGAEGKRGCLALLAGESASGRRQSGHTLSSRTLHRCGVCSPERCSAAGGGLLDYLIVVLVVATRPQPNMTRPSYGTWPLWLT